MQWKKRLIRRDLLWRVNVNGNTLAPCKITSGAMVHCSKRASVKKEIYLYYLVTTFALKKMKEHTECLFFAEIWLNDWNKKYLHFILPPPHFPLCTQPCRVVNR